MEGEKLTRLLRICLRLPLTERSDCKNRKVQIDLVKVFPLEGRGRAYLDR